jgi:glycosyltransferase involved in cell wall biosynthesis
MLFVGPSLLAGIGQVTKRYADLVGGEYIEYHHPPSSNVHEIGFAFVLPLKNQMTMVDWHLAPCKHRMYMTVCETETVHPDYGILVDRYRTLYVPSEFCKKVFERQFPHGEFKVLRHAVAKPEYSLAPDDGPYVFYTIGNMADPRKNIKMLLEAFVRLEVPNVRLLLKATCRTPYNVRLPGVHVLNDLMTDKELDMIHRSAHCYVNCSHSEGVGMGAVEAAVRDKPVILTDYGGLKEYVPSSPFVVTCTRTVVGQDDFLYTRDMEWGQPSLEDLIKHMRQCATNRITTWDHSATRRLIDESLDGFGGGSMFDPVVGPVQNESE